MDQKSWLWRKKPLEKTNTRNNEVKLSSKEAEAKIFTTKRNTNLERSVDLLNEKLSSTIAENNAKDDLVAQHAKVAEEAIAGWEKAEAEAIGLKKELENVLRLKEAAEDRVHHLDSALKECMLQLRHAREEQEGKIHEVSMQATREFDKRKAELEDKLVEKNKMICEIDFAKNQLVNALQMKEKLIDNLNIHRRRIEAELNELLRRMDSIEKVNSSLKYEVFMLQKELEIRNEDTEFSHKAADASHKQHLNDVKKITKLETECQRLRLLVQKRLPGPAALAKMKVEVEALGREKAESRRKISPSDAVQSENVFEKKRIAFLTEQLSALEEENKLLIENLKKMDYELQALRNTRAQTSSRVGQYKTGTDGSEKMHFLSSGPVPSDLALMSISQVDKISAAKSWASALTSEHKNFKSERSQSATCTSIGASDLSLMDDFSEMEKLALVTTEIAKGSSQNSDNKYTKAIIPLDTYRKDYSPAVTGYEAVPFEDCYKDMAQKAPSWLEDVLMLILQHSRVTHKSYEVTLEEVRNALSKVDGTGHDEVADSSSAEVPSTKDSVDSLAITSCLLLKTNSENISSNICGSVQKITELIDGIGIHEMSPGHKACSSDYTVRMFQWKSSELNDILHRFVQNCNDLLKEKVSCDLFFTQLASTFEWIMNHCFSLQDVSSMKDSIKKHYEGDDTQCESEVDECKDIFPQSEKISRVKLIEENTQLKDEISKIESRKKLLEDRLQSTENTLEALRIHLQESDNNIADLQKELALANESKDVIQNQRESQKPLNGYLDTEVVVVKNKLNDTRHKLQSLEMKFEDKSNNSEDLDAKSLYHHRQLESVAKNGSSNVEAEPTRTKWDISMASEKLAECQETILNLGKQLKALSSPIDIALLDKTDEATNPAKENRHSSLLDQIFGQDDVKNEELSSPKTKEIICTNDSSRDGKNANMGLLYGSKLLRSGDKMEKSLSRKRENLEKFNSVSSLTPLAIIPVRPKSRGGFFMRLFMRRKRGTRKRAFPVIPTR